MNRSTHPSVVLVTGIFNVLHPGHLRLLRFAKERGERLVVGVLGDQLAGRAAHVAEDLRLIGVQSNQFVDEAFLITTSVRDVIRDMKPSVVVKGREHIGQKNVEEEVLREIGGRLIFSSGESTFSSSDLISKELQIDSRLLSLHDGFLGRHDLRRGDLVDRIKSFSSLRVLVIGDLIVDEYVLCDPLGMSQEDPSIVVTPVSKERFVGGAGIVSMHASMLGSRTSFIAVAGDDSVAEFALQGLGAANVKAHILIDESRPTTLKQRFRASGRTLLRVSHLSQLPISTNLQDQILTEIEGEIHDLDLVIFSDFNLGSLPQSLVNRITALCQGRGVMMVADSQSSSQIGDISRFAGMRMIAPTEREARIALRNNDDGLVVLSEKLRGLADAEDILLTLGSDGVLIYSPKSESGLITDKLAAINPNPVDVAGAGDSMFVTAALTLASGGSIWEAAAVGSVAAAIQVSRLGNLPLNVDELTSVVAG